MNLLFEDSRAIDSFWCPVRGLSWTLSSQNQSCDIMCSSCCTHVHSLDSVSVLRTEKLQHVRKAKQIANGPCDQILRWIVETSLAFACHYLPNVCGNFSSNFAARTFRSYQTPDHVCTAQHCFHFLKRKQVTKCHGTQLD